MDNIELANRIKEIRKRKGLTQEMLAENSGVSLRTIQRIEKGTSSPTSDTLNRISGSLGVSPDEILDWQAREDNNILRILHFSQLGFIAFPLLGIIIPLAIWMFNKDKIKGIDRAGKKIINFQITWTLLLFLIYMFYLALIFSTFVHDLGIKLSPASFSMMYFVPVLYSYNILLVILNASLCCYKSRKLYYIPAISILR